MTFHREPRDTALIADRIYTAAPSYQHWDTVCIRVYRRHDLVAGYMERIVKLRIVSDTAVPLFQVLSHSVSVSFAAPLSKNITCI